MRVSQKLSESVKQQELMEAMGVKAESLVGGIRVSLLEEAGGVSALIFFLLVTRQKY